MCKPKKYEVNPCLESGCGGFLQRAMLFGIRSFFSIYGLHFNGWDFNMVVRWLQCCPWKLGIQGLDSLYVYRPFVFLYGPPSLAEIFSVFLSSLYILQRISHP